VLPDRKLSGSALFLIEVRVLQQEEERVRDQTEQEDCLRTYLIFAVLSRNLYEMQVIYRASEILSWTF